MPPVLSLGIILKPPLRKLLVLGVAMWVQEVIERIVMWLMRVEA
jgi:hypothetical protein